jgi:hypothetical protein
VILSSFQPDAFEHEGLKLKEVKNIRILKQGLLGQHLLEKFFT